MEIYRAAKIAVEEVVFARQVHLYQAVVGGAELVEQPRIVAAEVLMIYRDQSVGEIVNPRPNIAHVHEGGRDCGKVPLTKCASNRKRSPRSPVYLESIVNLQSGGEHH